MNNPNPFIDDILIEKISELSLLQFEQFEKEKIKTELNHLVAFYDKINTFPFHLFKNQQATNSLEIKGREDVLENNFSKKTALENATLKNENYFIVPKIIPKN